MKFLCTQNHSMDQWSMALMRALSICLHLCQLLIKANVESEAFSIQHLKWTNLTQLGWYEPLVVGEGVDGRKGRQRRRRKWKKLFEKILISKMSGGCLGDCEILFLFWLAWLLTQSITSIISKKIMFVIISGNFVPCLYWHFPENGSALELQPSQMPWK